MFCAHHINNCDVVCLYAQERTRRTHKMSCGWTNVHDMMRNESYIRTHRISTSNGCMHKFLRRKLRGHCFLAVGDILWAYSTNLANPLNDAFPPRSSDSSTAAHSMAWRSLATSKQFSLLGKPNIPELMGKPARNHYIWRQGHAFPMNFPDVNLLAQTCCGDMANQSAVLSNVQSPARPVKSCPPKQAKASSPFLFTRHRSAWRCLSFADFAGENHINPNSWW